MGRVMPSGGDERGMKIGASRDLVGGVEWWRSLDLRFILHPQLLTDQTFNPRVGLIFYIGFFHLMRSLGRSSLRPAGMVLHVMDAESFGHRWSRCRSTRAAGRESVYSMKCMMLDLASSFFAKESRTDLVYGSGLSASNSSTATVIASNESTDSTACQMEQASKHISVG